MITKRTKKKRALIVPTMSRLSHLRGLLTRLNNFSKSAVSKDVDVDETKGLVERFRKLSKPVGRLTAGYLIGYLVLHDQVSAHREELVKAELEKDLQVKKKKKQAQPDVMN